MNPNPEKIRFDPEQGKNPEAIEQFGQERREVLRQEREKSVEQSHENLETAARHEALEKAISKEHEQQIAEVERTPHSPEHHRVNAISRHEREASFQATMKEIQTHMSEPGKAFSKIIHNKTIEQISDAAANTIARPNAILSGAVCAFVLTLGIYVVAKNLGYPLSGFETIAAFILGWVIGIVYDFLKVMITGRR